MSNWYYCIPSATSIRPYSPTEGMGSELPTGDTVALRVDDCVIGDGAGYVVVRADPGDPIILIPLAPTELDDPTPDPKWSARATVAPVRRWPRTRAARIYGIRRQAERIYGIRRQAELDQAELAAREQYPRCATGARDGRRAAHRARAL